jgi:MoxR-like ATPase
MRSRCLYSWLNPPSPREEVSILKARCPRASKLLLLKMVKLINAIRSLPGITDKPGLRESITLMRILVDSGNRDLSVDLVESHLCFLAKRRLDLENLRKSLARVELMMEAPDSQIDSWISEVEEVAV